MKKIILPLILSSIIIFVGSCSKSSNNPPANSAQVFFFNGCANAGNLDCLSGSTKVSTGLAFLSLSGYQYVTAGSAVNIAFQESAINSSLVSGSENIVVNNHYSVFAGGLATTPSFLFTSDDLTAPTSGFAKIRFVNLCSNSSSINCYVNLTKLDTGLAYPASTPFIQVAATSSAGITMADANTTPVQATNTNITLASGKIYTIVMTGSYGATNPFGLTLTIINNN